MSKKIYLAGPVTHVGIEKAKRWRESVSGSLKDVGIGVLNPTRHGLLNDDIITIRCKQDVKDCDALLVNFLGAEKLSIGTITEIAWAVILDKPTVLVINEDYDWDYGIFTAITPIRVPTLTQGVEAIWSLVGA